MSFRIQPEVTSVSSSFHSTPAMPRILGIYIGDFNGDGRNDAILHGGAFPGLTDHTAQGAYAFWQTAGGYRLEEMPDHRAISSRATVSADFNRDGHVDLFFAGSGWDTDPFDGEQNYLFFGTGNGFANASSTLPNIVNFAHGVSAGDVNGDGAMDVLVNAQVGNLKIGPYLLINDGNGGFSANWANMPLNSQVSADHNGYPWQRWHWMALSDLDGDGLPELIAGKDRDHFNTPASQVFFNKGGKFSDGQTIHLPNHPDFGSNSSIVGILAEDFDGDGDNDVVMLSHLSEPYATGWGIQLLNNDGHGNLTDVSRSAFEGAISKSSGVWLSGIRAQDINHDGHLDIVIEAPSGGYLPAHDTPLAWLGNGLGKFTPLLAGHILSDSELGLLYNSTLLWGDEGLKFMSFFSNNGQLEIREKLFTSLPQVAYEATNGDDVFRASPSADIVDGLGGLDRFVFRTARSDVLVEKSGSLITVVNEGHQDRLTNVERLEFSDGMLAFDFDGVAGQAYRLYEAVFDRAPDAKGLGFWIGSLDAGVVDLKAAADHFVQSAEFIQRYGSPDQVSNAGFIDLLYLNILDRPAEGEGFDFWLANMDAGKVDRADVLAHFSESPENVAQVAGAIAEGIWYV